MHRGTFPSPPPPLHAPSPYARDIRDAREAAPVDAAPPPTRRAFLLGVGGTLAAAGVVLPLATWLARDGRAAAAADATPTGNAANTMQPAPTDAGTIADAASSTAASGDTAPLPQWVIDLQSASDAQLLAAAGDLEMLSSRMRRDQRLLPLLERLLDVALTTRDAQADTAGACAVRSLSRMGRPDPVASRRASIVQREELESTREAMERALGEHGRGRSR